jgi:uncharacterized membrane protein YgcG
MRRIAVLIVLVAGLALPAVASATGFKGVVVARQGKTELVAGARGAMHAISARAAVGSRVAVANGRVRVTGHARRATVHGTVVKRSGRQVFLAAANHVLAVNAPTPAAPSQPGQVQNVQVQIAANGELDEEDAEDVGQQGTVQIQAPVAAVGAGTVTLNVNGQLLTLALPAGLTLPASLVGQLVTVTVTLDQGQPTVQSENDAADDNGTSGGGDSGGSSGGDGGGGGDD